MVVVTIVGLLAALAVATWERINQKARAATQANDLRVFAQAFTGFAQQNAGYPPECAKKVFPPEMAGRMSEEKWLAPTPLGGVYDWDSNKRNGGVRRLASISFKNNGGKNKVTTDRALLEAVDAAIDDGNLETGHFVLGNGSRPVFTVEE